MSLDTEEVEEAILRWLDKCYRNEGLGQRDRVLRDIAARLLTMARHQAWPSEAFWERLSDAREILDEIQDAARDPREEPRPRDVWYHQTGLFDELMTGYGNEPRFANVDDLAYLAAKLLERPWLDSRFLEYVLVDAMIATEIRRYGESIVQGAPGPRTDLGVNKAAWDGKGLRRVLDAMMWRQLGWYAFRILGLLVIPGGLAWYSLSRGFVELGLGFAAVAVLYVGASCLLVLKDWIQRLFKVTPMRTPFERARALWALMHDAYRALEGAVVDPGQVKAKLEIAAAEGAVWSNAALALLNRVIARDGGAWVTTDSAGPAVSARRWS